MSSSFRAPPIFKNEEIYLLALCQGIWGRRRIVFFSSVSAGLLALAYAFTATPEYQVSSVLRPAAINELDALNRSDVYKLPPREALTKVGAALESYDVRLGFFRENQHLFKAFERPGRTLEQSFEEFNSNSIKLILPNERASDSLSAYIKLEMYYPRGVDGVAILNGLINYSISHERQQIAADLDVIVKNRLSEIKGKLDAVRSNYETEKSAKIALLSEADSLKRAQLQDELIALRVQLKTSRIDRMAQLNEAIGIAKSLGINKPATPSSFGEADRGAVGSIMRTEINNQQIPLYFMGVEALEAERSALQRRKSDDFVEGRIAQIARELQLLQANRQIDVLNQRKNEDIFLKGVAPMRAEASRLRSLSTDMSRLELVTIDKRALEPLAPIKPKKALIVVLGIMLGVVVGLIVAACYYLFSIKERSGLRGLRRVLALDNGPTPAGGTAPGTDDRH